MRWQKESSNIARKNRKHTAHKQLRNVEVLSPYLSCSKCMIKFKDSCQQSAQKKKTVVARDPLLQQTLPKSQLVAQTRGQARSCARFLGQVLHTFCSLSLLYLHTAWTSKFWRLTNCIQLSHTHTCSEISYRITDVECIERAQTIQ